jgi:hypothetical protein
MAVGVMEQRLEGIRRTTWNMPRSHGVGVTKSTRTVVSLHASGMCFLTFRKNIRPKDSLFH